MTCQRLLLALTCLVPISSAQAGWQFLELNALSNDAVLEASNVDGFLQIRSLNSSFETIVFEQPNDLLFLDLGAGDDNLTIDGSAISGFSANLVIGGSQGNDVISVVDLVSSASVFLDDSFGDNQYSQNRTGLQGSLYVYDGEGHQDVTIGPFIGDAISGSLFMNSSDGGSSLSVGNSGFPTVIQGGVFVDNGGFGDDQFALNGGFIADNVFLNHGNGKSNATTNGQGSFGGSFVQLVGGGELSTRMILANIDGEMLLHSGQGATDVFLGDVSIKDGLFLNSGIGFDTQTFFALRTPVLEINNGEGGSNFSVGTGDAASILPQIRITNLNGSDRFQILEGQGQYGTIEINNGVGNSTVEIGSLINAVGSLRVSSGFGNDRLTLDGVQFNGDVIAFYGDGGSEIDLLDVDINGQLELDLQDNPDVVKLEGCSVLGPTYIRTNGGDDSVTVSQNVFFGDFVAEGGSGFDIFATSNDNFFTGIEFLTGFELNFEFTL